MIKLFNIPNSTDEFVIRIHDEDIEFSAQELMKALKLMKAMVFEPTMEFDESKVGVLSGNPSIKF